MPRRRHPAHEAGRKRARGDPDDAGRRRGKLLTTRGIDDLNVDQLRALVDRLPDGVMVVEEDLTVTYVNTAARRLLHPTPLQLGTGLPDPWPRFSLPDYARTLFGSRPLAERHEVRPDQAHTYIVSGLPARKARTGIVIVQDESARSRRRRAEHEFVANAAHELLTPLTGIVGAAHVLDSGAKNVPEERDRFIAHIARECDRLTRIARALLLLARVQSGEQPPRFDSLALRPLLEGMISSASVADGVEVRVHCPDHLTVLADQDLVEQALANLLVNARRSNGRHIEVTAYEIDANQIGIDVADGGSGMTAEQLGAVAARFHKPGGLDSGGFGLGVSIAAQSIEALGGTLSYESEPGVGTLARVQLRSGWPSIR